MKNFLRAGITSFLMVLSFIIISSAQTAETQKDFSNVKIKNFGQMDEHFYRGAQPKKDEYQSLAALGVIGAGAFLVKGLGVAPLAAGAVLFAGCLGVLLVSVWRSARCTELDDNHGHPAPS